jgi:hypothetical protein
VDLLADQSREGKQCPVHVHVRSGAQAQLQDPLVALEAKIKSVEEKPQELEERKRAFEDKTPEGEWSQNVLYIEEKKRLTVLETRLAGLEVEERELRRQASATK